MARRSWIVVGVVAFAVFAFLGHRAAPDMKKTPAVDPGSSLGRAETMFSEAGFTKLASKTVGDPRSGHCGYDSDSTHAAWKSDAKQTVTIIIGCPIRPLPWVTYGGSVAEIRSDLAKAGFKNVVGVIGNRHPGRTTNCRVIAIRIKGVDDPEFAVVENGELGGPLAWTGDQIRIEEGCQLNP